jgi:two-component system, NtrC family, sensor kinase
MTKKAGRTSRGRILIIDDQEPTRYVFRHSLSRAGFDVEEAETGTDGLLRAMAEPDLIICDVNLPDMLGYDVCKRLKSNPVTFSIPVLQISASFVSDESKVQALEGGADSYLTQPVEPTVLIAQVNALLRLRRAESIANLSARQWQTTFDSLSDGVALLNFERTIVRTNRTFRDMLGLMASETERAQLDGIFLNRFGISFAECQSRFSSGTPVELPSGNRWFRLRQNAIESDPQEESGSVLLITEITAQRKLQETLKFNERLAATGRLAHVIAHEINNPLEAMSNLLFLAECSSTATSETHSYVQQASVQLLRISEITKQVLAYHRESKDPVATRADEVLDNVLAMYRSHLMGRRVALEAKLNCSSEIFVRPGELRQVFGNLISNALDAIGPGGGTLRVRCFNVTDQRTKRKGVRIFFSDSGSGIADELLPNIFDAFFTTKGTEGSGVGLWLSVDLLTKQDGYLRVRTRTAGPYRGTLFSIFLPLHVQQNVGALAETGDEEKTSGLQVFS